MTLSCGKKTLLSAKKNNIKVTMIVTIIVGIVSIYLGQKENLNHMIMYVKIICIVILKCLNNSIKY